MRRDVYVIHLKPLLLLALTEDRHLRLTNFSNPMSAPNPASVTTNPPSPTIASPTWSAMTLEFPDAMLAKGPAWTSVGVPSGA